MKFKIHRIMKNTFVSSIAIASCMGLLSAHAANSTLTARSCGLGETCPIPGKDGGQTVFTLVPKNGMHYTCEVKSNAESLKFAVTSGKNFSITKGNGMYNANPATTIQIDGRFDNPEDQNAQGEIRFTKLPFSSDGNVKCYANS